MLNRSAVIVTPKKMFVDWVLSLDPGEDKPPNKGDVMNDQNVYLVSDVGTSESDETREVMEEFFSGIATEEFSSWWTDEDDWPQVKTLSDFEDYFEWSLYEAVIDVCGEEIVSED